ncbi:5'-nucleotidase C-terminal domain-containing protein [bacterium]|nr:5'-nucleotidase C-terminal domain-containing protein [bacterium]
MACRVILVSVFAAVSLAFILPLNAALAEDNLDPTVGETAWGSYVTDSMRAFYKCDVAMIDAGTLSTLAKKEVVSEHETRLDIAEVEVVTIMLTGRELAVIMNNAVKFYPRKNNGFLQVSGMTVHIDPSKRKNKVVGAFVGNTALQADKVYSIAVTKFLANGGASFGVLDNIRVVEGSSQFVGELIAAYYEVNPEMPPVGKRYIISK